MNELEIFFGTALGVFVVGMVFIAIDKYQGCWHRWGKWHLDVTEDAYVQSRPCGKCGYVQIEQFKKHKEKQP